MKKGDKIIDVRDNTEHIVECVDVYDEVTLVFTEGKKYIPINQSININQIADELKRVQMIARKEIEQKFGIKF
jgi:ASC-1-like (ASCH) protein